MRMMASPRALLLVALVIAGCSTTGVREPAGILGLDQQLAQLLERKSSGSGAVTADAQSIDAKLGALADTAVSRGDTAAEPPSAVSFYRIAATAAWGAGPPHNTRLLPISDKGSAACARLPGGDASQPRDCALLRLAPTLATLDDQSATVRRLRDAGATIPASQLPAAGDAVNGVSRGIKALLEKRSALGALPESFDDYLKVNLNGRFCMIQGLVGRMDASGASAEQMERVKSPAREAQAALRASSVPTTCNQASP
jgi:hypothetical protein